MKITKRMLKQLIREELGGSDIPSALGPRKELPSELAGSSAKQRAALRLAREVEADELIHGMDINPYQALADAAMDGSQKAHAKLIKLADRDRTGQAQAILDATGLPPVARRYYAHDWKRAAGGGSPAELAVDQLEENNMKITKRMLKQIIKEELRKVLSEFKV